MKVSFKIRNPNDTSSLATEAMVKEERIRIIFRSGADHHHQTGAAYFIFKICWTKEYSYLIRRTRSIEFGCLKQGRQSDPIGLVRGVQRFLRENLRDSDKCLI